MMDFGLGFPLPPGAEADLVAVLRAHHASRVGMSPADIARESSRGEAHLALAESVHLPFWPTITEEIQPELLERFEGSMLRRGMVVPICEKDGQITVAVANPFNTLGIDHIQQHCPGREIALVVAPTAEIATALERTVLAITVDRSEIDALDAAESQLEPENFDLAASPEDAVPRLLRDIFHRAIARAASDVHFKVEQERFFYALRVGGDLAAPVELEGKLRPRIDAFLLSLVRIPREQAVREIGISGRFSLTHSGGRKIDCRYERHRTYRGYHVTIRLLDKARVEPKLGVGSLAFDEPTLLQLRRAMEMADGIIVLSGPTGSGKSTTLNAMLREIARPEFNTLTLENPVEDEIPGVTHCDLRDESEFGDYIRSFMRSDPDILLMGEVRDPASARLAVEAAITGHQVLTTVHTPSAVEIFDRFQQLGVARVDLARVLRLLAAQRLVKLLCPSCAERGRLTESELRLYSLPDSLRGQEVGRRHPGGCGYCDGRGYLGRTAVLEVLPIDRSAGEQILAGTLGGYALEQLQRERFGLRNLRELGIELVANGRSDLAAVKDVINLAYG